MAEEVELDRYAALLTATIHDLRARVRVSSPADAVAIGFAAWVVSGSSFEPQQGEPATIASTLSIGTLKRLLLPKYAANVMRENVVTPPPTVPPMNTASYGMAWACAAWDELGRPAQTSGAMATLIASQSPVGHFLQPSAGDNLEAWWYAELILLHAVGTHAARTGETSAIAAARRGASYHLRETQPDHATHEPWAVFPLLLQPDTRSLADQLLHNARMMPATGTALMLLADALYCLRLYLYREGSSS
jgi:hypothetical protein